MKNNLAILLLGSNIEREKNMRRALELFTTKYTRFCASRLVWETEAVGSSGPNFLNVAVEISTVLEASAIKSELTQPIEQQLGRVRTGGQKRTPHH